MDLEVLSSFKHSYFNSRKTFSPEKSFLLLFLSPSFILSCSILIINILFQDVKCCKVHLAWYLESLLLIWLTQISQNVCSFSFQVISNHTACCTICSDWATVAGETWALPLHLHWPQERAWVLWFWLALGSLMRPVLIPILECNCWQVSGRERFGKG